MMATTRSETVLGLSVRTKLSTFVDHLALIGANFGPASRSATSGNFCGASNKVNTNSLEPLASFRPRYYLIVIQTADYVEPRRTTVVGCFLSPLPHTLSSSNLLF